MFDALSRIDVYLFVLANSHHHPILDFLFHIVTQLGNGWVAIPLAGLAIAVATPRKYLARALLCAAITGTIAGTLNTQIKRLVDRPRPLAYFSAAENPVHVVGQPLRRHSFPSGHTATAFTAATILALLFGGHFYWAFAPALLVAYSRVYVGAHFPLDVLGGMAVGAVIAALCMLVARRFKVIPRRIPLRSAHA